MQFLFEARGVKVGTGCWGFHLCAVVHLRGLCTHFVGCGRCRCAAVTVFYVILLSLVSEIGESFDQVQMEKVFVASQQGLSRQENAYMLGEQERLSQGGPSFEPLVGALDA